MLPVSTTSVTSVMMMEDADIYRSHHQQYPAPSAVKVIKATDFSIAAIIGSSKADKPSVLSSSPVESAAETVKPTIAVFNFGKSST